jgi:uncharacterized integral membrane protein
MRFALILSLLIAIVAVVFAIYNPAEVTVSLVFYEITSPLAVVVIVILLAGVLVGILASLPSIMRRSARIRKLEKGEVEPEHRAPARDTHPEATRPAGTAAAAESRGSEETQRLAAETQRMAAEAQRRAAEVEKGSRSDT